MNWDDWLATKLQMVYKLLCICACFELLHLGSADCPIFTHFIRISRSANAEHISSDVHGFVTVVLCIFAKQNQAEVWPRFPTLLKLLLWTKVVEWLKLRNALCPLCLWQCFLLIFLFFFVYGYHVMVYWVLQHSLNWTRIFFFLFSSRELFSCMAL